MEKINLVQFLKDCPKGMELDCLLFNDSVRYNGLDTKNDNPYLIRVIANNNDYLV